MTVFDNACADTHSSILRTMACADNSAHLRTDRRISGQICIIFIFKSLSPEVSQWARSQAERTSAVGKEYRDDVLPLSRGVSEQ